MWLDSALMITFVSLYLIQFMFHDTYVLSLHVYQIEFLYIIMYIFQYNYVSLYYTALVCFSLLMEFMKCADCMGQLKKYYNSH